MERFINCVYKIVFGRTLAVVLMIALQILVLVGSLLIWESSILLYGKQ